MVRRNENNRSRKSNTAAAGGLGAAEQGVREAHLGAAGRFRWRERHDRFGVVVGEGVVEPRIEGRFARRVGAGMHAPPLLPEPELAQDALDDILLVDERNDANFP